VLAKEFAADGWRVAGVARSEKTIRVLVSDVPEAVGVIADASNPKDLERVFRDVGDVDLIVNAITTTPSFGGPIHEAPPDALEPYVGELLPAIFNVLRVSGRVLVERGSGTSIRAEVRGRRLRSPPVRSSRLRRPSCASTTSTWRSSSSTR
jgi:NAD(P)-dependent dehydrogenase (short-subunit alcohol dehydrogenase family)